MMTPKPAQSIKKFLRREKARLRREILDPKEAEMKIKELVERVFREYGGRKESKPKA